jgi:cob(I)alamin adenosyltransferase
VEDILDLLNAKPSNIEIVLTGRYADERVIEKADLVTEMKEIKHYFKKGVIARKGIEM